MKPEKIKSFKALIFPPQHFCKALYEVDDYRKGFNDCFRAMERELITFKAKLVKKGKK